MATIIPHRSHGISLLSMSSLRLGGGGGIRPHSASGTVPLAASTYPASSSDRGLNIARRSAVFGSHGSPTTSHEIRQCPSSVSWRSIRPNSGVFCLSPRKGIFQRSDGQVGLDWDL